MEKEIVEYLIVEKEYISGLISKVNEQIVRGWQPIGGVVLRPETRYFYQMVKYKKQ